VSDTSGAALLEAARAGDADAVEALLRGERAIKQVLDDVP